MIKHISAITYFTNMMFKENSKYAIIMKCNGEFGFLYDSDFD